MRRSRDVSEEDSHKRALEDYSQFSQYARTSAQFAFGANGGAAAAILSFLTSLVNSASKTLPPIIDPKIIIHNFAIASSLYLAGLLISITTMYFFALSKKRWGDAWEDTAFTGKVNFDGFFAKAAQRFEDWAWVFLTLSALAFAGGSYFSVVGFFQ